MKTNYFLRTLALLGLSLVTSARAGVIYDNTMEPVVGSDTVGGPTSPFPYGPVYDSFTSPSFAQSITGLELSLSPTTAGTITVGLYADSSTSPGSLLSTLATLSGSTIISGLNTVTLLTDPVLTPNTRYWIGLSDNGSAKWNYENDDSGIGVSGEYLANRFGVFPNTGGPYIMQLTTSAVSAVPDAGCTASILGLTFAGLAALRRKLA